MRYALVLLILCLAVLCAGFTCSSESNNPIQENKQIATEENLLAYLGEGMRLQGYESTDVQYVWNNQMMGEKRVWQLLKVYLDKPVKAGIPITGVVVLSNVPLETQKAMGNKGIYFTWDENAGVWLPAKPEVIVNH
jgi:hypothetical protein